MSDNQFRKHLDLFEGFWNSADAAQEILSDLTPEERQNLDVETVYNLVDQYVDMGDNPEEADKSEIVRYIVHVMGLDYEPKYGDELDLDADFEDDIIDVDYGDGMHDRENEDPEVYTPSTRWQYESVELSSIVESVLGETLEEAPRKKMPPRQKVPVEPMDDEDEFAAPERPVDVGDDIDFEDNIDDLDLDNLGIYVELDDY